MLHLFILKSVGSPYPGAKACLKKITFVPEFCIKEFKLLFANTELVKKIGKNYL